MSKQRSTTQTFDEQTAAAIAASLLADFPDEAREAVLTGALRVDVPARSVIYREDDEPRLALVVDGLVRVFMSSASGREATVRYATRGEILGVPTIVLGPAPVSVQILTNAVFLFLNVSVLRELGQRQPTIGWLLAKEVTLRLYDTLEGLAAATFGTLRQQVARHLLDMSLPGENGEKLVANVTQQELADAVGSVRPAVARIITELRNDGILVPSPGKITILRPIELHANTWSREV